NSSTVNGPSLVAKCASTLPPAFFPSCAAARPAAAITHTAISRYFMFISSNVQGSLAREHRLATDADGRDLAGAVHANRDVHVARAPHLHALQAHHVRRRFRCNDFMTEQIAAKRSARDAGGGI